MIEKGTNEGTTSASSNVVKEGAEEQTVELKPQDSMQQQHSYSINAKSLMEDEEDEDEEVDKTVLSRNPSLVVHDDELEQGERNSTEEPRTALTTQQQKDEEETEAVGQPSMACAPADMVQMCQGDLPLLPGCHGQSFAEQLELMTQCRHPLELFSVFHEHHRGGVEQPDERPHLLPGMYTLPQNCEYCGAEHLSQCMADCERPKSFFRKKRPPFCPRDPQRWDPVTDIEVLPTPISPPLAPASPNREVQPLVEAPRSPSSFLGLGDLFRKQSEGGTQE